MIVGLHRRDLLRDVIKGKRALALRVVVPTVGKATEGRDDHLPRRSTCESFSREEQYHAQADSLRAA